MHLRRLERYLRPYIDYIVECADFDRFICVGQHEFVSTTEARNDGKEPLKLVYNSVDRSLSLYSATIGKWLETRASRLLLCQNIVGASKFEPLIGTNENDGIVLRTVRCWSNLYVFPDGRVEAFKDKATKFKFLPLKKYNKGSTRSYPSILNT